MATPVYNSDLIIAAPPAPKSSADYEGNNQLIMDPAFSSTYTFDPTHPATVFKNTGGTPGSDLSTQTYLMLDGIYQNPYNTTDAQLFFIFTSDLVNSGAINSPYNTGTRTDPNYVSLDDIISGITVTTENGEKSLMACLVDVVIQEKYASEYAAGNTTWDPTVAYGDQPSFCDSLRLSENSQVAAQINDELDTYEYTDSQGNQQTTGKWTSYTDEMSQSDDAPQSDAYETEEDYNEAYAAYIREDTSEQWAANVNNSNLSGQESIMREAMVHDMGISNGLMASLMLLYLLLEKMGYSALGTLTDQVDWYQDRTDDLTEMSAEWEAGFDSPEKAYDFVGEVEEFVDEVNSCPQYADSSLATTVNSSLGEGGFLGMETDYGYYDSETNAYQQATVGYLYDNPDESYYDLNADTGYCDENGNEYTYGSLYKTNKSNPNTILYKKAEDGNIIPALRPDYSYSSSYYKTSGSQPQYNVLTTGYVMTYEVHQPDDYVIYPSSEDNPQGQIYPEKVYDKNGNQLTWGALESMDPDEVLYADPNHQYTLGYYDYAWQNVDSKGKSTSGDWFKQGSIHTIDARYLQDNFDPVETEDGKTALYDTFDSWSLDPSGQTPPAIQYQQVQSDFTDADTGFTNAAGTSTTLENQTSNWIQEVESAMAKAISTYIDAINTLIDNQTG